MANLIGQILLIEQFRVDSFVATGDEHCISRQGSRANVELAMKVLRSDLADDPSISVTVNE